MTHLLLHCHLPTSRALTFRMLVASPAVPADLADQSAVMGRFYSDWQPKIQQAIAQAAGISADKVYLVVNPVLNEVKVGASSRGHGTQVV